MAYCRIETLRLNFLTYNQPVLRVDQYRNVVDAVQSEDRQNGDNQNVGRRIILPSSFVGSPRYMRERYLDAMAVVRTFGKPSLLITVTANPEWDEIKDALLPGQTAQDRPELVARVFNMKINLISKDLHQDGIFGKSLAYMLVIEFQKRGLPHSHILLILETNDRLYTPQQVDAVCTAEIPDPTLSEQSRRLHDIVMRTMIHNQCGPNNSSAPCWSNNKCTKGFPKPFAAETSVSARNLYPTYRRRSPQDGGQEVRMPHRVVDNRWVVAYNPYLSLKYNAHINVEMCISVDGVKYIYMYIYKGPDRQMVSVNQLIQRGGNEIENFQDLRCIGSSEAAWKIYDFPMSKRYPSVEALPVHLKDQQMVYFQEGEEEQVAGRPARITKLTAWMTYNEQNGVIDIDCLEVGLPFIRNNNR